MENLIIDISAKSPEIVVAKLLKYYCFKDEVLYVGDKDSKRHLPDIYTEDLSFGLEVVQMERPEDFYAQGIPVKLEKYNEDLDRVKMSIDPKYSGKFQFMNDHGQNSFAINYGLHSPDWMKEIYCKNLNSKLNKLNDSCYSEIHGEIHLCVSMVQRITRPYDALLLAYCYKNLAHNYEKHFDKLYIVGSGQIFIIRPDKIDNMTPIIYEKHIMDFEITGHDYIEIRNIDYSKIIQLK